MKPSLITLTRAEYEAQPADFPRDESATPVLFVEGPVFPYRCDNYGGPAGWPAFIARRNSLAVCEIDEEMYWHWLEVLPPLFAVSDDERVPVRFPGDGLTRPVSFGFAEGEDPPTLFWHEAQQQQQREQRQGDSPERYFCQRGPWQTPAEFFAANWHEARLRDFAPLTVHHRMFRAGDARCVCDDCHAMRRRRHIHSAALLLTRAGMTS